MEPEGSLPPLDPILSQMSPVHTFTLKLLNVILTMCHSVKLLMWAHFYNLKYFVSSHRGGEKFKLKLKILATYLTVKP